jgi:hypothetical protein
MEEILDLTGQPARFDGALRGKRVSWQAFRELTRTDERPAGCPIPEGAILRTRKPRPRPTMPRLVDEFWLGRKAVLPKSYVDPTRVRRTWSVTPAIIASKPLRALLKPLSASATARHYIASVAVPLADPGRPIARRNPLAEEHAAGRIDTRLISAADWFSQEILASANAKVSGVRMRTSTGAMTAYGSRNPLDLWPAEASADRAIRLRWRFRTLGPLARIVWRALQGEEMADLAPAWRFPQRHIAEAGRIRLRAGLELCARMAEREVDRLPQWEVLEVAQAACAECMKLEATRRMRTLRPANDNNIQIPQRVSA